MICKWCGEDLSGNMTVCAHCGKEQPPLSDCGGFYNLAPNARPITPAADNAGFSIAPPELQRSQAPAPAEAPAPQKQTKKSPAAIVALCLAGAALLITLLSNSSQNKKIKDLLRKVSDLKESIRKIDETPQETNGILTEPAETIPDTQALETDVPTTDAATEPTSEKPTTPEWEVNFDCSSESGMFYAGNLLSDMPSYGSISTSFAKRETESAETDYSYEIKNADGEEIDFEITVTETSDGYLLKVDTDDDFAAVPGKDRVQIEVISDGEPIKLSELGNVQYLADGTYRIPAGQAISLRVSFIGAWDAENILTFRFSGITLD